MGMVQHDVVVATNWNQKEIKALKKQSFFDPQKFLVGPQKVNGITTICLVADGSNEGWPHSEEGNALRKVFIDWMDSHKYGDEEDVGTDNSWNYVEVSFGEFGTSLNAYNCKENLYA